MYKFSDSTNFYLQWLFVGSLYYIAHLLYGNSHIFLMTSSPFRFLLPGSKTI